jgi:mannose-6-phosphate isomerase
VNISGYGARGQSPFAVGVAGLPRVLVCIEGTGGSEHADARFPFAKGDVFLLPAVIEQCSVRPGNAVNLLDIALSD